MGKQAINMQKHIEGPRLICIAARSPIYKNISGAVPVTLPYCWHANERWLAFFRQLNDSTDALQLLFNGY